jgi:hypothetical protein
VADATNDPAYAAALDAAQTGAAPSDAAYIAAMQAAAPKGKVPLSKDAIRKMIANDPISQGARSFAGEGSDALGGVSQGALNLLAGGVRGAGSGVSTVARLFESKAENDARRAGIDENMKAVGAQPDSLMYRGGKIGAEVAQTAGIGGIAGNAAGAVLPRLGVAAPAVNAITEGLSSGGFRVAGATGAGGIAARAATGAAVGGASAGLIDPSDAEAGALIGGAVPVAAKTLGAAGQAIRNAVLPKASSDVAQLAQRAADLGIDIPADRLVDSRPLNAVASSLNYVPLSGRQVTENVMESQLNRAVSKTIGEDTSNISKAVDDASKNLGAKFDAVLSKNNVNFDQQLLNDLATVHNAADGELTTEAIRPIQTKINQIVEAGEDGTIPGQAAYNIKRDLDRIAKTNTPTAYWASQLKGVLMDALDRSLGPDEAAAFANTRKQYANLLQLEPLVPNGVEGEVSAARLANLRNIRTPELQELADIAAQFVKPREAAHGSAQRVFGAGGAMHGAGTLASLGGAGALVAGPVGAAVAPLATMTAGRAANAFLNSDTARNAILGSAASTGEDAMGAIGSTATKALPVLGAAGVSPSSVGSHNSTESIVSAGSVDDAISAANASVNGTTDAKAPVSLPAASAAVPAQSPPNEEQPTAAAPKLETSAQEPQAQWFGRKGDGYATPQDAQVAMPTRQKTSPDLDWRIEAMPNGRFRLAGYQKQEDASPSVRLNESGTAFVAGNPKTIRALLSQQGINAVLPTTGGVLVAKNQAGAVMDLLGKLGWSVKQ